MKTKISLVIALVLLALAPITSAYTQFDIHLYKTQEEMMISILDVKEVPYSSPLSDSFFITEYDENTIKIQLINTSRDIAYEKLIYNSFYIRDLGEVKDSFLSFTLPKLPNLKTFKLFYQGEERFSFDFSSLLCNTNYDCDENENYLSCRRGCPNWWGDDDICLAIKDISNSTLNYWEDNFCDINCIDDPDCTDSAVVKCHLNPNQDICRQSYYCNFNNICEIAELNHLSNYPPCPECSSSQDSMDNGICDSELEFSPITEDCLNQRCGDSYLEYEETCFSCPQDCANGADENKDSLLNNTEILKFISGDSSESEKQQAISWWKQDSLPSSELFLDRTPTFFVNLDKPGLEYIYHTSDKINIDEKVDFSKDIILEKYLSEGFKLCSANSVNVKLFSISSNRAINELPNIFSYHTKQTENSFSILIKTNPETISSYRNLFFSVNYQLCHTSGLKDLFFNGNIYTSEIRGTGQDSYTEIIKSPSQALFLLSGTDGEIKQDYIIPEEISANKNTKILTLNIKGKNIPGYLWNLDVMTPKTTYKYKGVRNSLTLDLEQLYQDCSNNKEFILFNAESKFFQYSKFSKLACQKINLAINPKSGMPKNLVLNINKKFLAYSYTLGLIEKKAYPYKCSIKGTGNEPAYCAIAVVQTKSQKIPFLAIIKNNEIISLPSGKYNVVYYSPNYQKIEKIEEVTGVEFKSNKNLVKPLQETLHT
ncbi:hypothetical protein HYW76_03195 [Candidatus Pacearchaeota archaeon]|nr:hypothetical protein [Candidatus Pacearchaeota archaeon]